MLRVLNTGDVDRGHENIVDLSTTDLSGLSHVVQSVGNAIIERKPQINVINQR